MNYGLDTGLLVIPKWYEWAVYPLFQRGMYSEMQRISQNMHTILFGFVWLCLYYQFLVYSIDSFTFDVRGPSYLGFNRSVSILLMPWLLASPGHQHPWYWLCRRNSTVCIHSSSRNVINCRYMFIFLLENVVLNELIDIFHGCIAVIGLSQC